MHTIYCSVDIDVHEVLLQTVRDNCSIFNSKSNAVCLFSSVCVKPFILASLGKQGQTKVGASTECLKLETAVSSLYFTFVHAKCDWALAGDC